LACLLKSQRLSKDNKTKGEGKKEDVIFPEYEFDVKVSPNLVKRITRASPSNIYDAISNPLTV